MDLKYRFYGDELQLVRYEIEVTQTIKGGDSVYTYQAADDEEKEAYLELYPGAEVTGDAENGYTITVTEHIDDREIRETYSAASDAERDELLERYPDAEVAETDNSGFEWLDGMIFTQEQLRAGELERAIELGEEEYKKYLMESDANYQMLELDMRLALLESGVKIDELYSVS